MKTRTFTIEGSYPLLMQSDKLADPIGPDAIKLKEYSGKRKKTDEDYEAMKKIEWFANLYTDDKKTIVIPLANLYRMMVDAAKLSKRGKMIERSVLQDDMDFPLEFDGPKDLRALYEKDEFVDRRTVVVRGSRVVRTRPRFPQWKLTFQLKYDPSIANPKDLDEILHSAGKYVGLGTYRPRFGRFEVVSCK